jgi:Alw26I/Eco31I/Esp3I family type II restriction m6 adenine DNA methyltransferase
MFGIDKGFDVVIGNPPYVQVPKGIFSAITFPYSEGKDTGKQNLYKVFVEASYNNLKANGTATMIVQSSLLCDLSSTHTRELLLLKTELRKILEYPKSTSNSNAQVFESVLQGTCTYIFTKKQPNKNHPVYISINNDTSTIQNPQFEQISQNALLQLYPDTKYIPLISKGDSKVLDKILTNSVPFKNYIKSINQGDLNLGTNSNEFSQVETEVKLYRGRNIHKYYLIEAVEEYVNLSFRREKVEENQLYTYIVMQEITGTTDIFRLHACLTNRAEKFLFGHTANKILLKDESLNYVCLAILNSKLQDWFFRKTSTNNHVMGYEIKQFPFPQNLKQNSSLIEKLSFEILSRKKANQSTTALEREIDVLVYKLYELTYAEVKIIDKDFWLSESEYDSVKIG